MFVFFSYFFAFCCFHRFVKVVSWLLVGFHDLQEGSFMIVPDPECLPKIYILPNCTQLNNSKASLSQFPSQAMPVVSLVMMMICNDDDDV